MQNLTRYWPLLLILIVGCIESYIPDFDQSDAKLLVVDGFVNASENRVTARLRYTLPLNSLEPSPAENFAAVSLEDDQGNSWALSNVGDGNYTLEAFSADLHTRYKLVVEVNQERIESDLVSIQSTPEIQSVVWAADDNGVTIRVNTGTEQDAADYYFWEFEETWEYTSVYYSVIKIENDLILPRSIDELTHTCWLTVPSSGISIVAANQFENQLIRNFPIIEIPKGSQKLFKGYSVLVRQQAIDRKGYEYWLELQKTTQDVGGLFDPLPARIKGNLRSISNPDKPVLGFFRGAQTNTMRISIDYDELPETHQFLLSRQGCPYDTITVPGAPGLKNSFRLIAPVYDAAGGFVQLIGYSFSTTFCTDCRVQGGTTTKPEFWYE